MLEYKFTSYLKHLWMSKVLQCIWYFIYIITKKIRSNLPLIN